jgi:putative DNA primase/helicase
MRVKAKPITSVTSDAALLFWQSQKSAQRSPKMLEQNFSVTVSQTQENENQLPSENKKPENVIETKSVSTPKHPTQPTHPTLNPSNTDTASNLAVQGQNNQLTSTIQARHLSEWVDGSGVSEKITRLNVQSLDDKKEIAFRLGWKRYEHTPGWWCSGVNPLTGKPSSNGIGQFKPKEVWLDPKTGDIAKYITPKAGYDAICLDVGDAEYWKNALDDVSIPIKITEGGKKAGSGLTFGYVVIALLGVWMGIINVGKKNKKKYRLVPTLRLFAQPGRVFELCFDADLARKKEVRDALRVLASLLIEEGCIVKVVLWDEAKGKGMDDFLVNNGKDAFDAEIARAQLIEEWGAQFEDADEDEGKKLPQHSIMATEIKPHMGHLRFNDKIHQWERYVNGCWSIATEASIFQSVTDAIEELYPGQGFAAAYPAGISKMLGARLIQYSFPEPPRNLLPFRNGVLNLDTKKLLEHSPEYNFTSIIDREHDLNATDWSAISEWMDFVLSGNKNQKHLLCCWYAAVLRGMHELHRCAAFIGDGGTGKSTAMKLAIELIGKSASHSLTLAALNTNLFQTGNIYDKRLVCINDADRYHGDLEIFKNITGGDEISIEWKFKKAFNALFKGLVMLSANNPIFTQNDSGLDRRLIPFHFSQKAPEIDTHFLQKLSAQASAFTNYLLSIPESEILYTLLYKVDESGVREKNELDMLLQTNAVAEWLNANYVYDPDSCIFIGNNKDDSTTLYGDYCAFALQSGSKSRSSKEFSPELTRLGKGFLEKRRGSSGFYIRGLRKDTAGGLMETIISKKSAPPLNDPTQPAHPTPNPQNQDIASNSTVLFNQNQQLSTLHNEEPHTKTVHPRVKSASQPTPTLHSTQTQEPSQLQATKNNLVQGVQGKSELREKEEKNNLFNSSQNHHQQIIDAWNNMATLGELVLSLKEEELTAVTADYAQDQIKHIRDAANQMWKPGFNRDAEYKGDRYEILEAGQSREVKIKNKSGSIIKVKRGDLRPWLGIVLL